MGSRLSFAVSNVLKQYLKSFLHAKQLLVFNQIIFYYFYNGRQAVPPKGHPNSVSENIFYENLDGQAGLRRGRPVKSMEWVFQ